jgi:hypothetical protein
MTRDIVNRLRTNRDCLAPCLMDEAADEIVRLERVMLDLITEIVRLTAERDEARREVLLWVKERCSWAELSDEIKKRGWEYLKEDGK